MSVCVCGIYLCISSSIDENLSLVQHCYQSTDLSNYVSSDCMYLGMCKPFPEFKKKQNKRRISTVYMLFVCFFLIFPSERTVSILYKHNPY